MRPRECDNDECDEEENGWVHAEGCEPMEILSYEELMRRVYEAPPTSFMRYVAKGMT